MEDNLSGLRILEQEEAAQRKSATAAREAAQLLLSQYREGITRYTDVLVAQTTLTKSELDALGTQNKRLTAAVTLVKALGGGWDAKALTATGQEAPTANAPAVGKADAL